MGKPYVPVNGAWGVLASDFVHGTDVSLSMVDASKLDAGGGYIEVTNDLSAFPAHYARYQYTGKTDNDLTGLTLCTLGDVQSETPYTFTAGMYVKRVLMGEDIDDRVAKNQTAPAAGVTSVLGIENGETVLSLKALPSLTELGYLDGVTSAIQTQLDGKTNRNALINGCFRVAQRGTAFTAATAPLNSDDTYLLDRWVLLSDGNDIVDVTQVTTPVPVGAYAAACFDIETEDKKWGILQILEAKDSARFIGGTVSLSFKARRGAGDTSTLLRAAVVSWSSTADTVTSDVVDAWGDEGTNPTLVANWTAENTPAALAELTDAYQTFKIEGIVIDTASTTNIAVFIWSDDKTNAVGDLVYIADVQLELSATATPFAARPIEQELALCQRYFEKSYAQGTAPGTATAVGATQAYLSSNNVPAGIPYGTWTVQVTKRATPTVTVYGCQGGAGKVSNGDGVDLAASSGGGYGYESCVLVQNLAGAITTTYLCVVFHWVSVIEL
jgi:hypothetical protein